MRTPEAVGTACSGSSAPSHALTQLVGGQNYKEFFGSEIRVTSQNIDLFFQLRKWKVWLVPFMLHGDVYGFFISYDV